MTRRPPVRSVRGLLVTAVLLGIIAQLLFFGVGIGINVPLAATSVIAAAWIVRPRRATPRLADAWFGPAAILLSAFVAVRGDRTMVVLDGLGATALIGAAAASFAGISVMERTLAQVTRLGARCLGWIASGAVVLLPDLQTAIPSPAAGIARVRPVFPVLRGLAIGLPIAIVFVLLFASADAVFAKGLIDVVSLQLNLGELPGRVALMLVASWLAAGLLAFETALAGAARQSAQRSAEPWRGLGVTEAVTVVALIDAVFAVFVALQGAYLFGGADTLAATGLTYAEYARRGFFELVFVVVLVGVLVMVLDGLVSRRTRLYVCAVIALCVLTLVVLASAAVRLRLYQEAYGWTELRFYVAAAIGWLGVCLLAAIVCLALNKSRWLPHAVVVSALAFGVGCNVLGPIRFIAEQNVARALHPELVASGGESGLDGAYLASLDDDAIPILVEALPHLNAADRQAIEPALAFRREELASPGESAWQAWSVARSEARRRLSR